jgi:hypothetical protein
MKTIQNEGTGLKGTGRLAMFFTRLKDKITYLFEPEEVEVTFRREGGKITYTYTKVSHKQVA